MSRPTKRARKSTSAYQDLVPFTEDNDFDSVHSREGRRTLSGLATATVYTESQVVSDGWSQLMTWAPPDDPTYALDPDGDLFNEALESEVLADVEAPPAKTKYAKSKVSRRPHVVWMENYRHSYLDEVIRWSGRGDYRGDSCMDCVGRKVDPPGRAEFRCCECFQVDLTCQSCCVKRHRSNPLHLVERWSNDCFTKVSLKSLGLQIQLNHSGMTCSNPVPCHKDLRVLHTNGIHDIAIMYCDCQRAIPQHLQLLRRRIYPASQISVQTAASFELLRVVHMLMLTTKSSIYDFYSGVDKLTNNAGMSPVKSRYRGLYRMTLQWRHLKMLKRAGRGHNPLGLSEIAPGELAIKCPSCPRPGVNLPDNWNTAPPGMKFLYLMVICMDANFRLKNNLVSNYSQDPGMGTGWSYMVPRIPYERYVLSRANDADISTCVGFQALSKANTKNSVGQRYTGVGMVVCGRSEMVMPASVGNLQKGERYANMDYIFGSALRSILVPLVLISYDIACQWFINLHKRINEHWPPEIKPSHGTHLTPSIPKLHEPMHQTKNHQVYSLNHIPGAGHCDCECCERVWASHNLLGKSTKTQGPGSRQDVLDDHFGFWNWLKFVGIGITLLRKYKSAVSDRNLQVEGHRGFTKSLKKELVDEWSQMCEDWEADSFPKCTKNPYQTDGVVLSEAQVKQELAEEEERRIASGGAILHETSASAFVILGLELEENQRRVRRQAKKINDGSTPTQKASLTEVRTQLRARIQAWEQLAPVYLPGLLHYKSSAVFQTTTSSSSLDNAQPEYFTLWLPSRIDTAHRRHVCSRGLPEMEDKLRTAQCLDALQSLRQVLKIKTRMIAFKNKNLVGQRDGTRSRAVIDRVHDRAKSSVEKYRDGRKAKVALVGEGDWMESLKVLNDSDVRGYQDADRLKPRPGRIGIWEDEEIQQSVTEQTVQAGGISLYTEERTRRDGTGETRRLLSWIWSTPASPDDNSDDILRSEWAKSRSRANRATEEVLMVKEEMRRVLETLSFESKEWNAREDARLSEDSALAEGLRAYAVNQASLRLNLHSHFRSLWKSPLTDTPGVEVPQHGDEDDMDVTDDEGGGLLDEEED